MSTSTNVLYRVPFIQRVSFVLSFFLSVLSTAAVRNIPANAGLQCDEAAVLGAGIKKLSSSEVETTRSERYDRIRRSFAGLRKANGRKGKP
jgi:hypothetical protein